MGVHAAKKRQIHSNVMHEAVLSVLELSQQNFDPKSRALRSYPVAFPCELAGAVMDSETGELLEFRQLIAKSQYRQIWGKAFENEFGRSAQGMPGRVEGTNTFFVIKNSEVPANRMKDVTYSRIICNIRPAKASEPNQCRITVGGDRVNYPFEVAMPTADLLTDKLLLNIII
jgi:hypothetical protein